MAGRCPECWGLIEIHIPLIKSDDTKHRVTIRTGLPNATWRKINYNLEKEYIRLMEKFDQIYDYKQNPSNVKDEDHNIGLAGVTEVVIVAAVIAWYAIYEAVKYFIN